MAKILELHSAKVRNTLNDALPAENRVYCSSWYDNSGNNNHGVLNSSLYFFDSRSGWLGSSDFSNYYNLYFGFNLSTLTIPTLDGTNFPQNEGTITIFLNPTEWTNVNNCFLIGNTVSSSIFARILQTDSEYGIQCGTIKSNGIYDVLMQYSTSALNRVTLNTLLKMTMVYKFGVGGYVNLFINGVKIQQVDVSDTTMRPTGQVSQIGRGVDRKKLYYVQIDNTVTADADVITLHNAEWKTATYALPILNKAYVAWGDSITWTQANGKEYPNLVHNYIKNTYGKAHYYNKGIGGLTSAELVTNLNSYNYIDGDIITIGVGTNDSANQGVSVANYTTNLGLAIDFIRSRNANAKIILCTPCGTSSETRTPYIADYRTAMEAVATAKNCYICKFHEAVTDENIGDYSSDGIHPNEAGHALLMGKLQPIIDEILG